MLFYMLVQVNENKIDNNICSNRMSCECKNYCEKLMGYSTWTSWVYNKQGECWCVTSNINSTRIFCSHKQLPKNCVPKENDSFEFTPNETVKGKQAFDIKLL